MGERLLCKQEVIGSIPFTSTTSVVCARSLVVSKAFAAWTDLKNFAAPKGGASRRKIRRSFFLIVNRLCFGRGRRYPRTRPGKECKVVVCWACPCA